MQPRYSVRALGEFLESNGMVLDDLTAEGIVEGMSGFYTLVSAEKRFVSEDDGDMLLFQCGTYDWSGEGATFQFELVRQFMSERGAISQLRLTAEYPAELGDGLPAIDRWCDSVEGLDEFREYIMGTAHYQAVASQEPLRIVAAWTRV